MKSVPGRGVPGTCGGISPPHFFVLRGRRQATTPAGQKNAANEIPPLAAWKVSEKKLKKSSSYAGTFLFHREATKVKNFCGRKSTPAPPKAPAGVDLQSTPPSVEDGLPDRKRYGVLLSKNPTLALEDAPVFPPPAPFGPGR